MRRFLILIVILTSALQTFAGDSYLPTFEKGRTWCFASRRMWYPDYGSVDFYIVCTLQDEKVEVNGYSYYKVVEQYMMEPSFSDDGCLLRESNGKIYRLVNGKDILIFDCGMTVGSKDVLGNPLTRIDYETMADGTSRRHYLFLDEYDPTFRNEYIEGVGYLDGTMMCGNWMDTGGWFTLEYCRNAAGEYLYGQAVQDGISSVTSPVGENPYIYNLQGQRLQKMQRGVNIVNGKKIIQRQR